jgi:diguanylate cyclase (GGDEF)-like protein
LKSDLPSGSTISKNEHPLYRALKQLAADLRVLFELAVKEDEKSWDRHIALAKREIESLQPPPALKNREEILLSLALIKEVYDHLSLLINTMKSSHERYKKLATRDLLTGVYNRNYFNETIIRDIELARRRDERLSFILIDVNDFKMINDTYGHLHGDGVLRACADILRKSVRKSDFLCRYGGDEFVIVTPQPACEANGPLFERIRTNLEEWNSRYATLDYRLSFSIGCAVWEQGRDVLQVIHKADEEMYRNKRSRNPK